MNSAKSLSLAFGSKDSRQLVVGVQSITVSDSLNGTASMTSGTSGHLSLIDSTVSQLWLPTTVCDNIASNFGLFYDVNTDLYIINSTMHTKWSDANPSFTFKLGETAYDNGKSVNIVLPYKAFDFQLAWPIYAQSVYYFPIRRAANDSQYVLGRTLLQEAYIIVDYDRKNFTLAAANFPDTTTSPLLVPITAPKKEGSGSGIGTGAIVGIVVGAIAVLALALGLFFWFRRKKTKAQKAKIAEMEANESVNPAYHKIPEGQLHEADGEQVVEMPGSGIGARKPAAELAAAAPVYEMEGDHGLSTYRGRSEMEGDSTHSSYRSPQVSSPGSGSRYSPGAGLSAGRPSPAQPSPALPSPISR
jgi:hypothetical protein